MNLYHCLIELRDDAKALAFAHAAAQWLDHLRDRSLIAGWQLFRRKLGLASGRHADFLLMIEVTGLAQLDEAFAGLSAPDADEATQRLYDRMHTLIASAEVGLYRPYPDPAQRERVALI